MLSRPQIFASSLLEVFCCKKDSLAFYFFPLFCLSHFVSCDGCQSIGFLGANIDNSLTTYKCLSRGLNFKTYRMEYLVS